MVQLSKLLTLLAATLAASAPLDLEKRTDGTATTALCTSAGCDNCNTGTRTAQQYGQQYFSPMETYKSIRYTGTHTGQAVSQIQLCSPSMGYLAPISPKISLETMPSIVVLGCGIYGLSTAYALARIQNSGQNITIIDVAEYACEGASGRPTTFLSDAHVRNPDLAALLRYSLAMHAELSRRCSGGARWQYQSAQNFDATPANGSIDAEIPAGLSWLKCGEPWTDAQWSRSTEYCSVDSHALGCFLLDEIRAGGAKIMFSTNVVRASRNSGHAVSALHVRPLGGDESSEVEIPCDRLLIAAGPWTAKVLKTLYPSATLDVPIYADTGSYSILLQPLPGGTSQPDWLNKSVVLHTGPRSTQLMMRQDGLVHAATVPPVTLDIGNFAGDSRVTHVGNALHDLETSIQSMLGMPSVTVLRRACFNPVTRSGLPIMSQVPYSCLDQANSTLAADGRDSGVYILGGHGYWGIAASLGSGKLMAQVMLGIKPDISLENFQLGTAPARETANGQDSPSRNGC
ncbi:hypothetical protein LTR97_012077 [Elasticomyces elasticus]|uniref:FAD dependent oxidoreductase domain-containing protein n=1 Tax=Elasticomyces elasticus TaxID=574655 RepID=A0AAN7VY02_9PEZI|nr:hypothetical protein LTR97_012077 [Elasticomyces elasticus]